MIKRNLSIAFAVLTALCSTARTTSAGKRTDALNDSLWNFSEWISVADAPVITGKITGTNERAADGASWFVSTVKNDKDVASARWMTSGLGIYELYVNGRTIGEEILKPGFTHVNKTKRSFTYDVTDALSGKAGEKNMFAVRRAGGPTRLLHAEARRE